MAATPFLERLLNAGHAVLNGGNNVPSPIPPLTAYADWPRFYQQLWDYYGNSSLYDDLSTEVRRSGIWHAPIKGLRNPCRRIVEFYAHHVWQGPDLDTALPLMDVKADVKKAIEQVWEWSNWQTKRQQHIRWLSIFGDSYIKVAELPSGHVILQQIDPRLVTEQSADERDYLTRIRLDDARLRTRPDGSYEPYTRTEIWDKASQTMKVWEYTSTQYDLSRLSPIEQHDFAEFGIDFIPFVWTKFQDTGEDRGIGAYTLLLDKIDELNQAATRLHQILFRYNRALLAVSSSGHDASGRALPPPIIAGRAIAGGPDAFAMGDDELMALPSGSDIKQLVPNIDYGASLAVVNAQLAEIENDAPELLYFKQKDVQVSGVAARFLLGPAIKTVEEVRSNAEAGLARAHQMALTIGIRSGAFPASLGTFEGGDFAHKFETRDVIPLSEIDEAQIAQDKGQAAVYQLQVGIKREAIAERLGFKSSDLEPLPVAITDPNMPTNTPQNGATNPIDTNTQVGDQGGANASNAPPASDGRVLVPAHTRAPRGSGGH